MFLNEDMDILRNVKFNEIDPRIQLSITCFAKDSATPNGAGYFMACAVAYDFNFPNLYNGHNMGSGFNTWLVRATLHNQNFKLVHPEKNAILLRKEVVSAVLEYADNKLLISVLEKDLLIAHNC